jgi:DNA-binding transcriptional MerR regulator
VSGTGSAASVVPGQASSMRELISVEISCFTVTVFTVTIKSDTVYPMIETVASLVPSDGDAPPEWTIDELAGLAGLPVRTIREYQTLGVVPAPRREGRIGLYGPSHLRRLQIIARLRDRGYSLAGIGDLLGSWRAGADLGEVLGLEPDQLVHVDEPGAPATLDQLSVLLPAMVPDHLAELEATGVIERCRPGEFCVPSPSLLQLAIDALDAGLDPIDVLDLLRAIQRAADTVADQVVHQIGRLPPDTDVDVATAFLQRGRGLLAHGVGRLTLHRIGRRLGVTNEADLDPTIRHAVEKRSEPR